MADEDAKDRAGSEPPDLALIGEREWREAERCASVIRPLAPLARRLRDGVAAAASELGLSQMQVYRAGSALP